MWMDFLSDLSKKKKNVFIGRVKNSLTQFICIYYLYPRHFNLHGVTAFKRLRLVWTSRRNCEKYFRNLVSNNTANVANV